MTQTSKLISLGCAGLFVIILGWATCKPLYNYSFLSHNCAEDSEIKELSFNGTVIRKFIDSANHNLKAISVSNNNEVVTLRLHFDEDSILWRKTKINDSVNKKVNANRFFIYRNNIRDTLDINYHCNN